MAFLDGLLARVLRRPVERLVAEAMNRYTHGSPPIPSTATGCTASSSACASTRRRS
jgi:hypothetical protein